MRLASTRLAVAASLLVLSAALVAGCAPGKPAPPSGPAGIVGEITALQRESAVPYSMLVEGGAQPGGALSDKASVTVSEKTVVVGPDGVRVARDHLQVGMTVKVWFTGPVAESYPIQGTAAFVEQVR